MKTDKIHYEQLFPTGVYANQRLRIEASIDEGDDISQCYQSLKSTVEAAFKSMNPGLDISIDYSPGHPMNVTQVESKETEVEKLLKTISECPTLRNLEIFANTVQRLNVDVLYEAYHNKKKELQ